MATIEQKVPPLVAGDKLSRDEFLRLWEAHPEIRKAELIGGIVYMPSPVTLDHGDTDNDVGTWCGTYAVYTPGVKASNNATSILLDDAPQPDVHLRILPEYGGKTWVEANYLHGAAELIAEVCRSSAAYDLHQKLELYREAGVPEYLTILLHEEEIRWHRLGSSGYELLAPGNDGIWRSQVSPGLWLAGKALLEGDMRAVVAVLQQGIHSPEHGEFVNELARRKSAR